MRDLSEPDTVYLLGTHELTSLPEGFGTPLAQTLETLDLHDCDRLLDLPESAGQLSQQRRM